MTTLLTFIGTAQRLDNLSGKSGYKQTRYQLPNGKMAKPVSLVAHALLDHHQDIDILVVIGTLKSHWDELTTLCEDENQQYALLEQWDNNVEHDKTAKSISDFVHNIGIAYGKKIVACIVPAPVTSDDHIAFFQQIDANINVNENIIVDVTHGFRSMPLLTYVALHYLKYTKQITIDALYYGEFIGKRQQSAISEGAIRDLHSVLALSRWVTALGQFKHSGNINVFASLLQQEGWSDSEIKQLKTAAYFERINNVSQASNAANNVIKAANESVMSTLIMPQLEQALSWSKQLSRGDKERALARQYFEQHDYLRAVIYAFEGLISTRLYDLKEDANDYINRDKAKKALFEEYPRAFKALADLRNNLTHGIRPNNNSKILTCLKQESDLRDYIEVIFKQFNI